MTLEPVWLWAILGVVLLSVEMATGTFYILWFGLAALLVSAAMWLFPNMQPALQYMMFAVLSLSSLAIWRLQYKKNEKHHRVGQSQGQEIGRVGTVTTACSPSKSGKITFTQGLMGDREWTAVSDTAISKGAEAEVVSVEGNTLRIKAI